MSRRQNFWKELYSPIFQRKMISERIKNSKNPEIYLTHPLEVFREIAKEVITEKQNEQKPHTD